MNYQYVIWSYEHRQWWRPHRSGYTPLLEEAGRYTPEEAGSIVTNSILLEEVAIITQIAEKKGPPTYHPYEGVHK